MPFAKLIVFQPGHAAREFEIVGELLTIGRALDNTISLDGDTNVSRYHAEIERRGDSFWVSDLGSSNGTTVNDGLVELDRRLEDGDLISTGGSTSIEFHLSQKPWTKHHEESRAEPPTVSSPDASLPAVAAAPSLVVPQPDAQTHLAAGPAGAGPPVSLILAGIGGGLLLTALVAIVIFVKLTPGCNPTARIISPRNGTMIREPIQIRVEVDGQKCIDRVIYQLDGQKIASSEVPPYDITFNPEQVSGAGGGNHVLSVTVEDQDGNRNLQSETVLLAFDNGDKAAPEKGTESSASDSGTTPTGVADSKTSIDISEVRDMVSRLARRIDPRSDYVFDAEFLQQVQARTGKYVSSGSLDRARSYHDVINGEFVGAQGLPACLGYVLALSRSNFVVAAAGKNATATSGTGSDLPQGLWRIQPSLAQDAGYLGRCGPSANLSDRDQKCAAVVASVYLKYLMWDIFRGDFVYAVSTFGLQSKEAAQFRDQLPPDRRDFWKVIKSGPQKERVLDFFAAGIVGENPQKFGLAQDQSLTRLY